MIPVTEAAYGAGLMACIVVGFFLAMLWDEGKK